MNTTIRIGLLFSALLCSVGFLLGVNDVAIGEKLFDFGFILAIVFVVLGFFSSVKSHFK